MKRIALLAFLSLFLIGGGEYHDIISSKKVAVTITDVGDTARVVTITPSHAVDSFHYHCSLSFEADTSSWDTVSWTSPVQTMIITPTVDVATTYSCSVAFKEEPVTLGVEKDYASGVATVAALIDTLVDMINLKAGLTDSVTAEDSVTYIKLVSNFSQVSLGDERWTMIMVTAGGAGALDSVSHVSLATVAIVCDSMVGAINASDSAAFFTAYDSTTKYIVQSDKKGLTFHIAPTDTVQDDDSSTTQENVTSTISDSGIVDIGATYGYKSLHYQIFLYPAVGGPTGIGNDDSGKMRIYSVFGDSTYTIAQDSAASLPLKIVGVLHSNVGDTLLRPNLRIRWNVYDTLTDSNFTAYYPLHWRIRLK